MFVVVQYLLVRVQFTKRDLLEWLAGLEPGQDGYGNEGDRAESGDQLSDEDESDKDEITHAVPFKCIGDAHEKNYQHHLEQAYLSLYGQDKPVNVRIWPEQLNPMDPSAIDLDYGTGWTHVGRWMRVENVQFRSTPRVTT